MAARYWVGGTATWDTSTTANWSASTGGASGATVPTAADDVFFDGSSGTGTITIGPSAVCRSWNCTSYAGTVAISNAISIGDATAGASNIALKFVAGMTVTGTGGISFVSTSATQQSIDFASKTTGSVNFSGVGASWQYIGAHTVGSSSTVTLNNGTLDINGQTCSWGFFNSSNTNTRTLTLGAASITLTNNGQNTVWNINTSTNLTFNPNTSTITISNPADFSGGTKTYNTVVFQGAGTSTISNANTFATLTRTGGAGKNATLGLSANQTVTGTFTVNSNSDVNRVIVQSQTMGTARTITAATVVLGNTVDFMDITGAGAATWTTAGTGATALGDCGGNSGITFTTPSTQTWSGISGGNWSANAWSGRVPLPQDDVTINIAFSASQAITADMPRLGKNISWSGATGSPTWAFNSTANYAFGSITLISGMTISGTNTLTLQGRSSFTLTSAGKQYTQAITLQAFGGTYTLADDFSTAGIFTQFNGSLVLSNFNITSSTLLSNNANTRSITMGSGTWTLTATTATTVWNLSGSGLTFSGASGYIVISTTSSSTRIFGGNGLSYGTLTYAVAGSTGQLTITGSNTFGTLNFSDASNARTLALTSGTTQTITTLLNVNGTAGKLMTINAVTGGSAASLSKSTGIVQLDYVSLQDNTATGGAIFYAGSHSSSVSNVTGWTFAYLGFFENSVVANFKVVNILANSVKVNIKTTYYSGNTYDWNPSTNNNPEGKNRGFNS